MASFYVLIIKMLVIIPHYGISVKRYWCQDQSTTNSFLNVLSEFLNLTGFLMIFIVKLAAKVCIHRTCTSQIIKKVANMETDTKHRFLHWKGRGRNIKCCTVCKFGHLGDPFVISFNYRIFLPITSSVLFLLGGPIGKVHMQWEILLHVHALENKPISYTI